MATLGLLLQHSSQHSSWNAGLLVAWSKLLERSDPTMPLTTSLVTLIVDSYLQMTGVSRLSISKAKPRNWVQKLTT